MKLPYLNSWDYVPVTVELIDGIDETGKPNIVYTLDTKCNFVEKTKTIATAEGQYITLAGYATLKGDIAPDVTNIAGYATIRGKRYKIFSGARLFNPDGTINHTRIDLV